MVIGVEFDLKNFRDPGDFGDSDIFMTTRHSGLRVWKGVNEYAGGLKGPATGVIEVVDMIENVTSKRPVEFWRAIYISDNNWLEKGEYEGDFLIKRMKDRGENFLTYKKEGVLWQQ